MSHGLPQGPVGVSAIEVKVRPPRLLRYEWMIVSALVVAGLGLGFAGARGSSWGRMNDSLELLYPHFPGAADAGTPWTMMVARFLLPLLALYATVRFVVSFYSQRVRLMRLRRLRGHTVVFGLTDAGLRAALTSARDGGRVVAVDSDGLADA